MAFKEKDKLKALAVVNIFETGKPFGDYAAIAVLNDGAGISYGVSQFTHKSGSLAAVIQRYFELGGVVGKRVIGERSELLKKKTRVAVEALSNDEEFKKALIAAALTNEMEEAQMQIALERYLKPALDVCEEKGFVLPLSLAVVYDSVTHGSWGKIAERVRGITSDQVSGDTPERQSLFANRTAGPQGEKEWITQYVRERDKWLASVSRLRKTRYRTQFFLKQIATGHWDLELPLNVNGLVLTEAALRRETTQPKLPLEPDDAASGASVTEPNIGPAENLPETLPGTFSETDRPQTRTVPTEIPAAVGGSSRQEESDDESCLDRAEEAVNAVAAKYDQAERIVNTVITRRDAAKSLWTTVVGTIWQTAWGIGAFLSGMPRTVWLVVAVIVGALMIAYLYRQIVLGRMREKSRVS